LQEGSDAESERSPPPVSAVDALSNPIYPNPNQPSTLLCILCTQKHIFSKELQNHLNSKSHKRRADRYSDYLKKNGDELGDLEKLDPRDVLRRMDEGRATVFEPNTQAKAKLAEERAAARRERSALKKAERLAKKEKTGAAPTPSSSTPLPGSSKKHAAAASSPKKRKLEAIPTEKGESKEAKPKLSRAQRKKQRRAADRSTQPSNSSDPTSTLTSAVPPTSKSRHISSKPASTSLTAHGAGQDVSNSSTKKSKGKKKEDKASRAAEKKGSDNGGKRTRAAAQAHKKAQKKPSIREKTGYHRSGKVGKMTVDFNDRKDVLQVFD